MDQVPRIITDRVPGPKSLEMAERLSQVESPDTTFLSPDFPVFWENGSGCIVTDVDGNTFLDGAASFGALSLGHCHPNIVAAISKQSQELIHGMGDVHPSRIKVDLLELITKHVPIKGARIILGQSGAESVESAMKTAFLATGKPGVIAFDGGYHGLTYGTLEPTARPMFRYPFSAQRGRFTAHLPYACDLSLVSNELKNGGIGAVIVEPLQGRGGINVPPTGWLRQLQTLCHENSAILIVDEIYTGWGRTGKLFASEWEGDDFEPDLICIGKAMGGGMPISACVGSAKLIEKAWPKSQGEALQTSTFLGHPIACAAAIAAIKTIVDQNLTNAALVQGQRLHSGLNELAQKYPNEILEVRGIGLMLGIQMASRNSAAGLMLVMLRSGLIVLLAGDNGDVVELTPPLIIANEQIDWVLTQLGRYFAKLS